MFSEGQFEEFNINENILINLASDEHLIYKLKRVYFSKLGKLFQVFIFISPLIVLEIISYFLTKFGYGDIGLTIFLLLLIPLIFYLRISMNYIFSPLSYSIYITNKNFYFIEEKWKSERIFYVMELNNIVVINSNIKKEKYQNQERGQLEFIYNNAERIYIVIPKIRNISRIKKIFETIIWQYSNRKERLKDIKYPLEYEYEKKNRKNILSVFDDKVVLQKKGFQKELNFDDSLIISKKKEIHITQFGQYGKKYLPSYSMSIFIKFSADLSKKIKFGPINNYLEILETIYLNSLSWKHKTGYLLDKKEIVNLEKINFISAQKQINDKAPLKFEKIEIPQEVFIQFEKYIDKRENIITVYFPKKQILQLILFSASIYIVSIIIFYLISYFIPFFEFISFLFISGVLGGFIIFIVIIFLFNPSAKFIFTNEKIILKFRKKLCFSSYNNISKIVCNLNGEIQEIKIYFKETLKGDCVKSENDYTELYPPKTLRIFELLKNLSI